MTTMMKDEDESIIQPPPPPPPTTTSCLSSRHLGLSCGECSQGIQPRGRHPPASFILQRSTNMIQHDEGVENWRRRSCKSEQSRSRGGEVVYLNKYFRTNKLNTKRSTPSQAPLGNHSTTLSQSHNTTNFHLVITIIVFCQSKSSTD